MISGDQTVCAEAQAFLGELETAVVKIATGMMSAECFPPEVTGQRIHDAAFRAVTRLREGGNAGRSKVPPPLRFATPLTMEIDFVQSEMADKASQLPGASREGRTIRYVADDILTLFQAFRCALALAR
jgi:D-amino peptidase